METNLKISDAEWEVMKIIWDNPYCSAGMIIDKLDNVKDWKPKTVKTLIKRLSVKGIIGFEPEGREYRYYPLLGEDECVKMEKESFLKRVYRGSRKAMLISLIDEELTNEDIEELKHILNERK